MIKEQYFNIEVNLLFDDAVVMMMHTIEGGGGLGVYVALLAHLRRKDDYSASCLPVHIEAIARTYRFDLETVQRVLHEFGLFVIDEESMTFRSPYLDRVMEVLEKRWKVNQDNGKKGGRPEKQINVAGNAVAKDEKETTKDGGKPDEKPSDKPKLTKENKRDLKRTITTVEYNSSNSDKKEETAAAVVVLVKLTSEPIITNSAKIVQPGKSTTYSETVPIAYPDLWQKEWEPLLHVCSGKRFWIKRKLCIDKIPASMKRPIRTTFRCRTRKAGSIGYNSDRCRNP